VAGEGIVVTNAHVVAGEDDTTVQVQGTGAHLPARAIWFDPHDDIAVLRVGAGLGGVPALRLNQDARSGTSGAVLGFPHDGPYDVEPARIGSTNQVLTQDAYGAGPVRRDITSFRGLVRSGNSGGPVVDGDGRVLATVFAASVGSPKHTGFGVPDSVVRAALGKARLPVSTGPCAR
jgi:S1-C subfamily serine protease